MTVRSWSPLRSEPPADGVPEVPIACCSWLTVTPLSDSFSSWTETRTCGTGAPATLTARTPSTFSISGTTRVRTRSASWPAVVSSATASCSTGTSSMLPVNTWVVTPSGSRPSTREIAALASCWTEDMFDP